MSERKILEQNIINLKAELSSDASRIGDWAIIKCYEARLAGKEDPYDLNDLIAKRQAIRDQINELQNQLNSLTENNN